MIFEILHKYLDEDIDNNDLVLLSKTSLILESYKEKEKNKDNKIVVLLDDIHIKERSLDLSNLRFLLYDYFPKLDIYFYNESLMLEFVDIFITRLKPYLLKEYFRKDNKYVYYILIDNKKYYLYEYSINTSVIKPYCLFLSYIWCLYKVHNFNNFELINYIKNNKFNNKNLVKNILIIDEKYSIIEDKVLNLLNFFDIEIKDYIILEYIKLK